MSFQCLKTLQAELRPIYLTDLIDFSDIQNTKSLNLSNKSLSELNNLPFPCTSIKTLDLSHNKLKTLSGLSQFHNLVSLDLSYNQIVSLFELNYTQNKYYVLNLCLKANPCARHPNALPSILAIFPKLRKYDGVDISDRLRKDIIDGFVLERKMMKYFVESFKIIRKLEQGVKCLKIEYELLQACKGRISAESGPYWEDINARHLRDLNKMVQMPKISEFWSGCEIAPSAIIDFIDFVSKALDFEASEFCEEKLVFEWAYKEVLLRLHKWGSHGLQLFIQEGLPGIGDNEEILVFKGMRLQGFRINEFEKPKKKLDPVSCDWNNSRVEREWEVFPVFPCDKGYLKAVFDVVQDQLRRIKDLQREKLELLSFDSSSIGIPSFADRFYQSSSKGKLGSKVLVESKDENRIRKVENKESIDPSQKKFIKANLEERKNNENYIETDKTTLKNTVKNTTNFQFTSSLKCSQTGVIENIKKALKILTKPLNKHSFLILHQILNFSSNYSKIRKPINHYKTTLLKKYFTPIRYLYILTKAKSLKSYEFHNSRLLLDSFYAIRNSALQNKHLKKRKREKEALKALKTQETQKQVQQEYENLISRLTENKQNIQKIWKILKENSKIPQDKCACGGFKCQDCISTKLSYIKNELQFLKQKLLKQPK